MKKYSDLKLHQKISIVMITIFLALAILLTTTEFSLFTSFYKKQAINIANQWARVCERNISQIWSNINENILKNVVKRDFVTIITNNKLSELQKRVELHDYIASINSASILVDTSFFLTDKGEVLFSFDDIPTNNLENFSYEKLKDTNGITVLAQCNSPFKKSSSVVPVIIPYKQIESSPYLGITNNNNDANVILVILLNANLLQNELVENTDNDLVFNPRLLFNGVPVLGSDLNIDDRMVIKRDCVIKGLEIEISTNSSGTTPIKSNLFIWVIIITVILILLGIVMIRLTALRLTAPFFKITRMMNEMKENTYKFDIKPENSDESGMLITGLNEMYKELSDTMLRIKEEEEQKFKYLSQMLTEQINPHFTYNTLEMINMEIESGNYISASEMVTAFSLFLRHSLNHGQYLIVIENELVQVENYMKIMNYRLNGVIDFKLKCTNNVKNILIPKSILQPLVENSIKHGFDSLNSEMFINPFIEI
ncbi:MAG: histidine kinase, partial [Spirochaetales bacterium]|nr:histidine kinase [Spirochaetales bacterium]